MHPKNRTQYKSLDKIAADPRVQEVYGEGADGLWIELKPGYSHEETSNIHEWSVTDLLRAWKNAQIEKTGSLDGVRRLPGGGHGRRF